MTAMAAGPRVAIPRVAIQGESGSFSHEAAQRAMGRGRNLRLRCFAEFAHVFRVLASGEADGAVVPIENSAIGRLAEPGRLLAEAAGVIRVAGWIRLPVRHCLIGRPGTAPEGIRRVRSHPVALAQCRGYLASRPSWELVPATDTAGSVRVLMARGPSVDAAIASAGAARRYGARILAADIQDDPDNITRFAVLERSR